MDSSLKHTLTLISDAKKGDKGALERVCERYVQRVHKIVTFRMGAGLRGKTESMDIVQSVMIKAIRDIDAFDTGSESKFINWLAKIVENTIRDKVDYFAAEKRRAASEIPIVSGADEDMAGITDIPDKISPTVTQEVENREKLAILSDALNQIKDSHREAIILRDYAGMTFKEIGELTDSTEDAARMLYVRSMDEVTDILADMMGE
ncbi:MAG: sigma-70 family RNA polymerase sigma factor [Pseudomonadota bacterium]